MDIWKLLRKFFTGAFLLTLGFVVLPSIWRVDALVNIPLNAPQSSSNSVIKPTPSMNSLFCFVPAEVNQGLYGCPIVTSCGFITDLLSVSEVVLSGTTFFDLACDLNDNDGQFNAVRNTGLNQALSKVTGSLLEFRPISGVDYINQNVYALSNLGNVNAQEDTAQNRILPYYPGLGYQLQAPMQAFWGWGVNVVYGFLVVLIILVAIAITFRSKLGGSAVVTLQNSIPNIALAMILVPLSFAITGLFIDGITLGVNVVHGFLLGPGAPGHVVLENGNYERNLYPDDSRVQLLRLSNPLFGTKLNFGNVTRDTLGELGEENAIVSGATGLLDIAVFIVTLPLFIVKAIIDVIGFFNYDTKQAIIDSAFGGQDLEYNGYWWIGQLINVGISILFFLTGLRIWWLLFKKFLTMVLAPLFSPFVFATIAIPGMGFKNVYSFLKSLASVSMFFIVAYFMILLANIVGNVSFIAQIEQNFQTSFYIPPLLNSDIFITVINSLSESSPGELNSLIALFMMLLSITIYLSIPKTLKDIDAKLGTDKSSLLPIMQNTLQSAKDSLGTGAALGNIGLAAISGTYNRMRGVEPGRPGSAQYGVRRVFSNTIDSLERRANDPNRLFITRGYAAAGARVTRELAKVAGVVPHGFDEKGNRLEPKFNISYLGDYVDSFGIVTFTEDYLKRLYLVSTSAGDNTYHSVNIQGFAIIQIAAENAEIPYELNSRTVSIQGAKKDLDGATDIPDGVSFVSYEKSSAGSILDIFDLKKDSNDTIILSVSDRSINAKTDGRKAKILLDLQINNLEKAFGCRFERKDDDVIITYNVRPDTPISFTKNLFTKKIFIVFSGASGGPAGPISMTFRLKS
jgi:hypothetical protein